ncbi:hypothetical protein ACOMHN_046495 [Nucella lapillus]
MGRSVTLAVTVLVSLEALPPPTPIPPFAPSPTEKSQEPRAAHYVMGSDRRNGLGAFIQSADVCLHARVSKSLEDLRSSG